MPAMLCTAHYTSAGKVLDASVRRRLNSNDINHECVRDWNRIDEFLPKECHPNFSMQLEFLNM